MLKKMAFSIDDPMMDMKISELGELLSTLQRQLKAVSYTHLRAHET